MYLKCVTNGCESFFKCCPNVGQLFVLEYLPNHWVPNIAKMVDNYMINS